MRFSLTIDKFTRYGVACVCVDVPLVVLAANGPINQVFRHDTGCAITTVSEKMATTLGLPPGGRPAKVRGSTGNATGRIIDVRFRFPRNEDGSDGLEVPSEWLVVPGNEDIALLGFNEFHRHFNIETDAKFMYFEKR